MHVSSFSLKRTVYWALLLAIVIALIVSKGDESGKIEKEHMSRIELVPPR